MFRVGWADATGVQVLLDKDVPRIPVLARRCVRPCRDGFGSVLQFDAAVYIGWQLVRMWDWFKHFFEFCFDSLSELL